MIQQEASPRPITYHTVTLGALTREGDALAEITLSGEDGQPTTRALPVPAGLPGEVVTIAVEMSASRTGKRKRHYKPLPPRVWITEIHQPSPLRIEAACPVFGTCGGCQLQHMQYSAQLAWKRAVVEQLLREVGQFADPPLREAIACDDPWQYRNHMRFSVNRDGQPGLTARGTHRVLPLAACPIAHEQINRALAVLSRLPNARPQVLIRCGAATGQMLIQPTPNEEALAQLRAEGLDIHSETMEEQLDGQTFRIRPSSFFQTNTAQAEKMAQMVMDGLFLPSTSNGLPLPSTSNGLFGQPSGAEGQGNRKGLPLPSISDFWPNQSAIIIDAYCGVGTFALLLAQHAGRVIAIEESPSAITDAQWNLRAADNVEIMKGKVEDILPALSGRIDGLVIDPPRAGCQRSVLDALVQHPASRVVYVSCDPATLARDLHILCHVHAAYRLLSVQPLDMFPHTAHIECVTVLEHCA
jgi:23S rRNA (uracil1939-C5)-methyltransferase